jgi:hypothetical protein
MISNGSPVKEVGVQEDSNWAKSFDIGSTSAVSGKDVVLI